jgi:hypothetical protein
LVLFRHSFGKVKSADAQCEGGPVAFTAKAEGGKAVKLPDFPSVGKKKSNYDM